MIVGFVLGGLVGLGLLLVVAGVQGRDLLPKPRRRKRTHGTTLSTRTPQRVAGAAVAGVLTAAVTGWPVAAVSVAALIVAWPRLFGAGSTGEAELERVEALAVWTESLRDTISGQMSLEEAIPATLDAAPSALVEPLHTLHSSMRARVRLDEALLQFADELDDASADLIIAALVFNANLRGGGLVDALTELGRQARDELELRQRVEAGRKPLRRAAWIIVGVTLSFTLALAIFAGDYVAVYDSVGGQVVLAIVIAFFAASFAWARKLSAYAAPPRFLLGADDLGRAQLTGAQS